MNKIEKAQKRIHAMLIVSIITLFTLGIWGIKYKIEENRENVKIEEEKKREEIERVNKYFRENHNYYLQKISEAVSIAPRQISVNELKHPEYFLVEEDGLTYTNGMDYFSFHSKEKAIGIWNKLNAEEHGEYILISQSIIRIPNNNEKEEKILKVAQSYFENSE